MERMLDGLSLPVAGLVFLAAAAVTWIAGISLAKTTDTLDTRWKIGDALGGLVLLGIAGSLPEVAVVWSAAVHGRTDVIIGNLIGGLSIQTLVIVIFDLAVKGERPLSYHAGSLLLFFETLFAIVITALGFAGMWIPKGSAIGPLNPMSIAMTVGWFAGLFLINRARKNPAETVPIVEKRMGRMHDERRAVENHPLYADRSTASVLGIFAIASLVTLVAGVVLEQTGNRIAEGLHIGSGLFAATAIALVTSLPEISTGLESIFLGDHHLAVSDIMGGNAFMMVIFPMADLVAGKPVLSYATHVDMLLVVIAILMMAVYAAAFLRPPQVRFLRMGLDSIGQIVVYVAGMFGLKLMR